MVSRWHLNLCYLPSIQHNSVLHSFHVHNLRLSNDTKRLYYEVGGTGQSIRTSFYRVRLGPWSRLYDPFQRERVWGKRWGCGVVQSHRRTKLLSTCPLVPTTVPRFRPTYLTMGRVDTPYSLQERSSWISLNETLWTERVKDSVNYFSLEDKHVVSEPQMFSSIPFECLGIRHSITPLRPSTLRVSELANPTR